MKKAIKYLFLILALFTSISCENWLELLPPNGLVKDEYWNSKEEAEAVLMATYGSLAALDKEFFLNGELRADMLQMDEDYKYTVYDELNLHQNSITPTNNWCKWDKYYQVIRNANDVIKNAPKVLERDKTLDTTKLNEMIAEAYFLRSLTYFYLVRLYKDVPLLLQAADSDNTDFYIEKSTEDQVLNQIVSDLNQNRNRAPEGNFLTQAENKGRASKAAFDALLADIELWRFKYEQVLEHIVKIDSSKQLYVLMPTEKWFTNFYPGNTFESIFEIQFDQTRNQSNRIAELTQETDKKYLCSVDASELLYVSTESNRGKASLFPWDESQRVFGIRKYTGIQSIGSSNRSGSESASAHWIVYRYAEVVLMKVEALSQLGRYDEALKYLNDIRIRAGVTAINVPYTVTDFEDAILNERALELAFEGKRWFDLIRMGRRNNYERKSKLIDIIVKNASPENKRRLTSRLNNPYGWYLPIPQSEIDRNNKLKQNPYYED